MYRTGAVVQVMAWMEGSNADLGEKTYEELIGTLEVAEMWDKKDRLDALDALGSGRKGLTKSYTTRSTPFDGMRMLYIEHQVRPPSCSIHPKHRV